ncbi:hypothetical protein [Streptomyces roseolilacinus]|uniref:Uncharacterized protein n=1 Tax=Streptomyces roseolilacinus TaxID=66904 RepID=A0A918EK69_9ACTN|nr:hypothetical protein [Streptomyces roseolilacinus]GGQ12543.1 hypothetical protein GCM10010249_33980 [Streptomyces roseolilacinus]
MGLFSRKPKTDGTTAVTISGEELSRAAHALNRGNQKPADDLVERAGRDEGLRRSIALRILGASIDQQ